MEKLSVELMARCDGPACCENELIVLPPDGDAGFEAYFERKAKQIYRFRHLLTRREEQTRLILRYPTAPARFPVNVENAFNRFFNSPDMVAGNQPFEGCFGIDLTDYLHKTADPELDRLIAYIRSQPDVTFVLFVYASDEREALPLMGMLDQYFPLRLLRLTLPDTDRLTAYAEDLIREICPDWDGSLTEDVRAFFARGTNGYDTAEFLARELKERGFRGERQTLLDVTDYIR